MGSLRLSGKQTILDYAASDILFISYIATKDHTLENWSLGWVARSFVDLVNNGHLECPQSESPLGNRASGLTPDLQAAPLKLEKQNSGGEEEYGEVVGQ